VLDEASMVDTWLFYSLIKAIDFSHTRLIMLGDPAQLPPVGAGQPFVDALENELIPHSMLTKIFRQSDDKAITLIAQQVREGVMPKFQSQYTDAFYVNVNSEDREDTNKKIEAIMLKSCSNNAWGGRQVSAMK
jgi:exodeoxyribonuclease V alpha subunit